MGPPPALAFSDLDCGSAATAASGLVGALWWAHSPAAPLARLQRPALPAIHHSKGNLCSVLLGEPRGRDPIRPVGSGGHTETDRVDGVGAYTRPGPQP